MVSIVYVPLKVFICIDVDSANKIGDIPSKEEMLTYYVWKSERILPPVVQNLEITRLPAQSLLV